MKTKHREIEVYKGVRTGVLEIDSTGAIWKIGELRGNRWNSRVSFRPVERRRAEHDQGQYLQVRRTSKGRRVFCLAHRLVWMHFHGPIKGDAQINHKNGDKKDNRPENLELVTASENIRHAYKTGLKDEHGEKNPAAKLTDAQVEAIRMLYAAGGVTQQSLATKFLVTLQQISKIVRGERRPKQGGPTADYVARRSHKNVTRDRASGRFLGA